MKKIRRITIFMIILCIVGIAKVNIEFTDSVVNGYSSEIVDKYMSNTPMIKVSYKPFNLEIALKDKIFYINEEEIRKNIKSIVNFD